jgi:RES domain-containing protein
LAEALAANRYYGFPDHRSAPLVFVTAQANLKQVIDLREGANRQRLLLSEATILETDWRKENHQGQESVTQAWGWAFHLSEIEGILCPSAAHPSGSNLIAFPEHFDRVSRLKVLCKVDWPR